MTNEIRRIKAKLKLFEEEGFSWVVIDILDTLLNSIKYREQITDNDLEAFIENIRKGYLEQLQELLPPDIQQGKLNL